MKSVKNNKASKQSSNSTLKSCIGEEKSATRQEEKPGARVLYRACGLKVSDVACNAKTVCLMSFVCSMCVYMNIFTKSTKVIAAFLDDANRCAPFGNCPYARDLEFVVHHLWVSYGADRRAGVETVCTNGSASHPTAQNARARTQGLICIDSGGNN